MENLNTEYGPLKWEGKGVEGIVEHTTLTGFGSFEGHFFPLSTKEFN